MKRVAPFFPLLLLLACSPPSDVSTSEISIAPDELIEREGLYYAKFSTNPFSGKAVRFHDNGQLRSLKTYRNGKLHGPSKKFLSDGELTDSGNYIEGKKDGVHLYTSPGPLDCCMGRAEYKNGQAHGESKNYMKNGMLVYQRQHRNDLREGLEKRFYENGQLKSEGHYERGEPVGLWAYYDEDGNWTKPQSLFLSEWLRSVQLSEQVFSNEQVIANEALHISLRCAALFTTIGRLNPVLEEKVSEKAVWMFTLALQLQEPLTQEDKNFAAKTMRSFDEFYTQMMKRIWLASSITDLDDIDWGMEGDVSLCEQLIEETEKTGRSKGR